MRTDEGRKITYYVLKVSSHKKLSFLGGTNYFSCAISHPNGAAVD